MVELNIVLLEPEIPQNPQGQKVFLSKKARVRCDRLPYWGILGLYIFLPEFMGKVFGPLTGNHPLFFLAVYAPAIAAFILVACKDGIVGLRRFLGRALLWRCSVAWYAFLIIGIPLIFIGGSALRGNLFSEPFPFTSLQSLSVGLFLAAIKGPVEEIAGPETNHQPGHQWNHPCWLSIRCSSKLSI
jgi:hypothetical protein